MPGLSFVFEKPVHLKGYLSGSDYFCRLREGLF
jgi:hypothetical protein